MSISYDLVIAGGGLGGAALAKNMAEHGAKVLVIEREREFKDRVRGECMFPWGNAEAHSLGVAGSLSEAGGYDIHWMDVYVGPDRVERREIVPTTPQKLPCLACYHPAMQESLLRAAAAAGATVRRGATVREAKTGAARALVVEEDGRVETIPARLVVGAEGRSSAVRTSAHFTVLRDPEDAMIAGVLLENVSSPEVTLEVTYNFAQGQIVIVIPQGNGRARMYMCYHDRAQARLQGTADLPRFGESCVKAGANAGYFGDSRQIGPLATFSCAQSWVEHPYRDGVVLLGDTATSSDPVQGQGLSLTLRDARVLRDCLLNSDDWDAAADAYAAEHDAYAGRLHLFNQWISEMYFAMGPEADARRARAMALIAQDPTRQPDSLFCGPDMPADEAARKRFFAED
ncbi:MAG TPA: FAD-dependent monooxygenase [Terracidiphilus sp.]|jgi:2-polyprenyl-6-methoxyphenol hydroxylase-like FAD-dependent oxidoreductase|nr:FAD-dependent monooxygenase [Terracidiphilus sp.]